MVVALQYRILRVVLLT